MGKDGNERGHGRASFGTKRQRDEGEISGSTKRQATGRNNRRIRPSLEVVNTRPHDKPTTHSAGETVKLSTNFFRLRKAPTWNIHHYHLEFEPALDSTNVRKAMVYQHKTELGGFICDGAQIFSTHRLHGQAGEVKILKSTSREGQSYDIKLNFTGIIQMNKDRSLQILNLIIRKAEGGLDLQLVGRHFYDARNKIPLREFHIELWPGYTTSAREYETDILLNCDVSHKVMRTDTAYDIMKEILRRDSHDFKRQFQSQMIGKTYLTSYNNRTYRIDAVDFVRTPNSTFKKGARDVSFVEYFRERFTVKINDTQQPLLIVNQKAKDRRAGRNDPVILIPELCCMTGLDDSQRTNIQ